MTWGAVLGVRYAVGRLDGRSTVFLMYGCQTRFRRSDKTGLYLRSSVCVGYAVSCVAGG